MDHRATWTLTLVDHTTSKIAFSRGWNTRFDTSNLDANLMCMTEQIHSKPTLHLDLHTALASTTLHIKPIKMPPQGVLHVIQVGWQDHLGELQVESGTGTN